MIDRPHLSKRVRENPLAKSHAGLDRLYLAMRRIQSVLEREQVAAIRTLEMKISDAGPTPQRVDPHILGLAGLELTEKRRVVIHHHPLSATHNWYAPARLSYSDIEAKLDQLVSVYLETTDPTFTAGLGDPLEISVFKILSSLHSRDRRLSFLGSYDLTARGPNGRYRKIEPPSVLNAAILDGPPDFILYHPATGEPALIECKNLREWIYPSSSIMKTLVAKALAADMTPILIARRLPYITKALLCEPAGIIAHETYNQLYPDTREGRALASKVREKRGLGYADVRPSEEPLPRTVTFFEKNLPKLLPSAAEKFARNRSHLQAWVVGAMTWRQLRLALRSDYREPDAEMDF